MTRASITTTWALSLLVIVVLVAAAGSLVRAQETPHAPVTPTPSYIYVNKDSMNATLTLYPVAAHTQAFLQFRNWTNCSHPAPITDERSRTHVFTLNGERSFSFPVHKLRDGDFFVCFRNATGAHNDVSVAGALPTGYNGFHALEKTVRISRFDSCAGGKCDGVPQHLVVTPQSIFVNQSTVNATIHIYPAPAYTQVFLQYRDYQDCTQPPSIADEGVRTHVRQLDLRSQVTFRVSKLRPGLYFICFRNATAGAGYTGFRPLNTKITLTRYDECSGGRFGVCKVTPPTLNGRVGNSTVQLFYAPPGKQAFIMKPKRFGVALYNCSSPPPVESGMRSPVAVVKSESKVTFETFGLVAGSYDICYKNNTKFERLVQTLVVSGPIDPTRSTVSCCNGPFTVGQRAYCQINTVDSLGNPAGGPADACELRVCPLTDGRGDAVSEFVEPYFVSTGLFEFHFTAQGSGCGASASASFKGLTLGGNKINFFTILPAPVDPRKATSDCSWSEGITSCNVTRRDTFGNPVSTCHVSSSGALVCVPTVQA